MGMGYSVVVVLVGLLSTVLAEPSHYHDVQIPQVTSDLLEDIARHMPCPGENCPYKLRVAADVHVGHKKPVNNCIKFCDEFFEKEFHLENRHPQLTALRIKFLSYLKEVSYTYLQNPEKPKDLVIEVLSEFILLIQRLKEVFEKGCLREAPEDTSFPIEEIIAEEEISPGFVGSVRGIPGVHFPNYTEVPITSFSCGDVKYIPGFYADLETRCQVFHVCYEHRRESFLCPVGTTFNQPILACDYWYSSNCTLSSHYYDVNAKKEEPEPIPEEEKDIEEIITTIIEQDKAALPEIHVKSKDVVVKTELEQVLKFLPVKAKVLEFSVQAEVKPSPVIPEVKPLAEIDPRLVVEPAMPIIKFAASKAKAIPVLKAKVVKPILKAKVAAAAIPVVKSKIAAAIAADALKAKVAMPIVKSKIVKDKIAVAAALPVKAKIAAAVPVKAKIAAAIPVKAKIVSSAALPLLKAKTVAKVLPVVKAAAISAPVFKAKAAMISPLTKKALALGYMKLLKAKKLALIG